MYHVVKIGSQYLTSDGTLTDQQSEALRIYDRPQGDLPARFVKVQPHGSLTSSDAPAAEPTADSGQL